MFIHLNLIGSLYINDNTRAYIIWEINQINASECLLRKSIQITHSDIPTVLFLSLFFKLLLNICKKIYNWCKGFNFFIIIS